MRREREEEEGERGEGRKGRTIELRYALIAYGSCILKGENDLKKYDLIPLSKSANGPALQKYSVNVNYGCTSMHNTIMPNYII